MCKDGWAQSMCPSVFSFRLEVVACQEKYTRISGERSNRFLSSIHTSILKKKVPVWIARASILPHCSEQYAADDFRSAGMDDDTYRICFDPETSLSDKWMLFEPFYQSSRNTAYCKAVEIAIRDLYGIDALNEKTIHTLSERIAERNRPGVLKWILRDRCNIEHAMINAIDTTFIRRGNRSELIQPGLVRRPSAQLADTVF